MSLLSWPPELVWGLIPRFVGLIYVLAFVPVFLQHDVMPGARGLAPNGLLRERLRRDLPALRSFLMQPSLLWIDDRDATQRGMCVVGALCGVAAIVGGSFTPYALLVAWLCWLSLEIRGLVYPWDTMLQEVGFLVLFLPSPALLPDLHASALPLPSVAFMVRWLVLRLMLGFAKEKFWRFSKRDMLYLRGFFVWMPLPTRLGWYAHHAPAWLLKAMLLFMFVAEAVAPVLGLFAGPLRIVSFALLVSLMVGIHITGNWGFFNVGYALLCVCLLDTESSLWQLASEPWASRAWAWPDVLVHLTMALLFVQSLFYLLLNSWLTRSWVNWSPEMFQLSPKRMAQLAPLHRALAPLRALAPFRLVNGYGVFPPDSGAPIRFIPVIEGSDDGEHWQQYGYRSMPSFPHSPPPFIAPSHARLDQWAYYVALGLDSSAMTGSVLPTENPYTTYARASMFDLLLQRILHQDARVLRQLGHNPFPDAPPKLVRVGYVAMTPTRPSERRATGHWWHVRRAGTLFPARGIESWAERVIIPEPELFHPDLLACKRATRPLRAISAAYAAGVEPVRAVLAGSDLTEDDVAQLWTELVPMLAERRGDWSVIHERAAAVEARFGVERLYRLERLFERFAWLLRDASEAQRFGRASPALPELTNFQYHLLLHEQLLDGRAAYEQALKEPARLVARARESTPATQLWALGQLRYHQLMMHVRCFRANDFGLTGVTGLPSLFGYHDFLRALVPPDETFYPRTIKHSDGEFTIEGFYPPPPLSFTPDLGDSTQAAQ